MWSTQSLKDYSLSLSFICGSDKFTAEIYLNKGQVVKSPMYFKNIFSKQLKCIDALF